MGTITNLGAAIYSSLAAALILLFAFIPKLIGFLVILIIGFFVAKGLEKGITLLLHRVGFDRVGNRIGLARMEEQLNMHMDASAILGKVVFWFVFLIFLIPAFNALELTAVSALLASVISYVPNIFVAIIVLFLGTLLATFAYDVIVATSAGRMPNPRLLGNIVRYAIIGFTVLIALEQLQIAPALISILFTAVVGAAALAIGLSFGLGGRDTAHRLLTRSESVLSGATDGSTGDYAAGLDPQARFNQPGYIGKEQPSQPISTSAGSMPSNAPGSPSSSTMPQSPSQTQQNRPSYPSQQQKPRP